MVVDATGLRVYGSGEWHVRKHRHGRRRAWRKLHLGVDERTKEIVAVEVTPSRVHGCRLLPALLDQIPGRIVQVSGDGAYDTRACYQSILEREAVATIPPRRNAIEYLLTENQVLREKLGKRRILLNDDQRRRLAVKGKCRHRCRRRPISPVSKYPPRPICQEAVKENSTARL